MTTTAKAPVPVVHLKSREEDDTAVCGHKPQDAGDILVDTLDDDPVVDCLVCRDLEDDADDPFDYEPED